MDAKKQDQKKKLKDKKPSYTAEDIAAAEAIRTEPLTTKDYLRVQPLMSSLKRNQPYSKVSGGKWSTGNKTNGFFFEAINRQSSRTSLRYLLYCGVGVELVGSTFSEPIQTAEEKQKQLKEDMIMDIKRAILFLRDGHFRKAEDILHVALTKARNLKDPQGEVYVLDLLANLYYEERQYDKAEATFKEVLRRELAAGKPEDTDAIVEISAKLARMYAETRQFDKARAGFDFCLEKLEKKLETLTEDKKEEVVDLFFKVLQWGSEFLLNVEDKADEALVEATELIEHGLATAKRLEQTGSAAYQTLANNLSTLYTWQVF
ncbi:putative Tetratricopeptide repeat protein 19-like protein, mitochondrial, partial [Hypsibius exemplaris]